MSTLVKIILILIVLSSQLRGQSSIELKSKKLDSLFSNHKYGLYINEVENLSIKAKQDNEFPFLQQRKAIAHSRIGEYKKSINEFKIAIELLESKEHDSQTILDAYEGLSHSFLYLDLDSCIFYKDLIIREARLCPEERSMQLARALQGKAFALLYQEEYSISSKLLDKAETILIRSEDESAPVALAELYSTKAFLYRKFGDLKKALVFSQKALTVRTKIYGLNNIMLAGDYNNLAVSYSHLRNFDKSTFNYKKSLELVNAQSEINIVSLFQVLTNIASALFRDNKYEEAMQYLFESIKIGDTLFKNEKLKLVYNYYLIGGCYQNLNDEINATKYYNLSINLRSLESNKYLTGLSDPLIKLGEISYLNKDYEIAINYFNQALSLFPLNEYGLPRKSNISSRSNVYIIYAKLAQVFLKKYNETNDLKDFQNCEKNHLNAEYILNQLIGDINDYRSKQIIIDKSMITYELGIELAYLKYLRTESVQQVEQALNIFENSRNVELNGWLHSEVYTSDVKLHKAISEAKKCTKEIQSIEFETKKQNFPNSIQDTIYTLNEKLDSIYNWISDNYGKQFYSNLINRVYYILDIQHKLKKSKSNDVLINLFRGDKSCFRISIWQDGHSFEKLDQNLMNNINFNEVYKLGKEVINEKDETILENMLVMRNNIGLEFQINRDFISNYKKLYKLFLKSTLKEAEFEKIIVIPDKDLSFLSFEAFLQTDNRTNNSSQINYRTLPYVIIDYDVVYEYSISTFISLEDDVIVNNNDYVGYSPFSETKDSSNFEELPYTKDEISAGTEFLNGDIIFGSNAHKKSFTSDGLNHKVVHLATHGVTNDEGSFVYFHPNIDFDDDILSLEEIYSLNMNTDVLILSACESGKGEVLEGEGIVNFGRVFIANGCKSVVESLWQVNDKAGSVIIQNMFKNLKSDNDLASSLSKAKRQYIQNTDNQLLTHPFFWAPLVQRGDVKLIKKDQTYWWFLGIACIPLLIIAVSFNLSSRHK